MSFLPRTAFPAQTSLPRSYFLGHHKAGLQKMKTLLSSIDLVIECRDYRVPLTSRNPLFEESLEGKERLVVYTKRDLGLGGREGKAQEEIVSAWHQPTPTLFTSSAEKGSIRRLLDYVRDHAQKQYKLVGHRLLVVGMPNVGKSTLLNALRAQGIGKGKVAQTGAQPGVTRKVGSGVKIVPSEDDDAQVEAREQGSVIKKQGVGGGVYLVDTPGVFIPYVPDAEAMLKLALCGSVKDTIIPPVLLADYLLYQINIHAPSLYASYCESTNEITVLLASIAHSTGRLMKGGQPDLEACALWMIQRWRTGHLGKFMLDAVSKDAAARQALEEKEMRPSLNQARKATKEKWKQRAWARGQKK